MRLEVLLRPPMLEVEMERVRLLEMAVAEELGGVAALSCRIREGLLAGGWGKASSWNASSSSSIIESTWRREGRFEEMESLSDLKDKGAGRLGVLISFSCLYTYSHPVICMLTKQQKHSHLHRLQPVGSERHLHRRRGSHQVIKFLLKDTVL